MTDPSPEPQRTQITARLAAQGAMLEELRTVANLISPEAARADAQRAIVDENALRRSTLPSRRKLFAKLSQRYFPKDMPRASAELVRALRSASDPQVSSLAAYVMLLWNDALLFRLSLDWLAPKLRGASYSAVTADIERELQRLRSDEPTIGEWSEATLRRIARHYLGTLRDVGYASGSAAKRLRRPYIPPRVILFGVQRILGGGESPAAVPEHPLFTALGLSVTEVTEALGDLARDGLVDFAVQGGVVLLRLKGDSEGQ